MLRPRGGCPLTQAACKHHEPRGACTPPQAILIPRTRFAPVKTTADMLALMSDAYGVTEDYRMELKPERNGIPPNIKLDGCYKFVDDMMGLVKYGPPSLIKCTKLTIEGKMYFEKNVVFEGE
ncbi:MAG: hypothetical protein SGPRY_014417, partial [Prymnesium sp.]